MHLYPYTAPIILTDNIFLTYGGQTGTTTLAQRQAAYLIAEQQVSTYVGTFLLPTRVSGTTDWIYGRSRFATEYGYVHNFVWIRAIDHAGLQVHVVSGANQWASIKEDTFGYIDVSDFELVCGCHSSVSNPYKFQYVYDAGLPTGTANNPSMLLALTGASQIVLNEMSYPSANESTGDAGVTQYSSLDYSETRKGWKNTALGSSAKSAFIARMIDATFSKARRALFL
jgi:hypothetical protein